MAKSSSSRGTALKKPKREPPLKEPAFCLWIEVSENEGDQLAIGLIPTAVEKQLVAWGKWVKQWQSLPTVE